MDRIDGDRASRRIVHRDMREIRSEMDEAAINIKAHDYERRTESRSLARARSQGRRTCVAVEPVSASDSRGIQQRPVPLS